MVPEANLARTENGLVPEGAGWFVVNARDAPWLRHETFGAACTFEGAERFQEFGINIHVLMPGQPNCMYHGEEVQEDFLVLLGECLLLVEGEERRLVQWDFVHCPPWTEHVFVGAGTGPCAVMMVGTRRAGAGIRYPVSELAERHGAGVEVETGSPAEAYAPFERPAPGPYREGDLPTFS
jgi:uncharacterized cupin superfamily protein